MIQLPVPKSIVRRHQVVWESVGDGKMGRVTVLQCGKYAVSMVKDVGIYHVAYTN